MPEVEVELQASNPDSITELFGRMPETWTDAELDRAIAHLRKTRAQLGEKPTKAKASSAPKIAKEDLSNLSTGDLLSKLGVKL